MAAQTLGFGEVWFGARLKLGKFSTPSLLRLSFWLAGGPRQYLTVTLVRLQAYDSYAFVALFVTVLDHAYLRSILVLNWSAEHALCNGI